MTKTKEIVILIIVAVVIAGGWWFGQRPKLEPESPPEYEKVNFCGKEYLTQKIEIEGVDVVRRIAEITEENNQHDICDSIALNNKGELLETSVYQQNTTQGKLNQRYAVWVGGVAFTVIPDYKNPGKVLILEPGYAGEELFGILKQ
jgi:hypothetical protein